MFLGFVTRLNWVQLLNSCQPKDNWDFMRRNFTTIKEHIEAWSKSSVSPNKVLDASLYSGKSCINIKVSYSHRCGHCCTCAVSKHAYLYIACSKMAENTRRWEVILIYNEAIMILIYNESIILLIIKLMRRWVEGSPGCFG